MTGAQSDDKYSPLPFMQWTRAIRPHPFDGHSPLVGANREHSLWRCASGRIWQLGTSRASCQPVTPSDLGSTSTLYGVAHRFG